MLILVVGPSSVGKDTFMRGARWVRRHDPKFHFVQREIDRKPSRSEPNIEVSRDTYSKRRIAGAYALFWRAHGRVYGIPRAIEDHLANGRTVVVNVSRKKLKLARRRYGPLRVVVINAKPEAIERWMRKRGRETDDVDIRKRMERAAKFVVDGPDVIRVWNDGSLREGMLAFLEALCAETKGPVSSALEARPNAVFN